MITSNTLDYTAEYAVPAHPVNKDDPNWYDVMLLQWAQKPTPPIIEVYVLLAPEPVQFHMWNCPSCARPNVIDVWNNEHPALEPHCLALGNAACHLRRKYLRQEPLRCTGCSAGWRPLFMPPYDGKNVYRFVCRPEASPS